MTTPPPTVLLLALTLCLGSANAQQGVNTRAIMRAVPTITLAWNAGNGATFTQIWSSTNLAVPIKHWTIRDTATVAKGLNKATFPMNQSQEFFIGSSK